MSLVLPPAVRETIVAHAREGAPAEVCGVLAGGRGDPDRVDRAIRTDNVAADPRTAYEIAPERLHAVLVDVEAAGDDVVGFYHSHPEGPAAPSPTDEAAATWVDHVYLIVDPGPPTLRAHRWTGDGFEAVPLVA